MEVGTGFAIDIATGFKEAYTMLAADDLPELSISTKLNSSGVSVIPIDRYIMSRRGR